MKIQLKHHGPSQHYFSNVFVAILPSIYQIIYQNVVPSTFQFHNANRGKNILTLYITLITMESTCHLLLDRQHQKIQPHTLQGCHFDITLAYPHTDVPYLWFSLQTYSKYHLLEGLLQYQSYINLPFLQILFCNVQ